MPKLNCQNSDLDHWLKTHLSAQQYRAWRLHMAGVAIANIASILGVSRSTVRTHLERAKEKLGVRDSAA